ncbi:MAG: protein translocase subunit SecD [Deltaproteobacteria bacterium]|nr:protein translocase subunit SecD [Deltaproteobacteria bacterium]
MIQNLKLRMALVLAVAVLGVVFLLPTLMGPGSGLPAALAKKKLNLGLDLQGGMHLMLEVEAEKAVETRLGTIAGDLRETFRDKGVRTRGLEVQGKEIRVLVHDAAGAEQVTALTAKNYPGLEAVRKEQTAEGTTFAFAFSANEVKEIERRAVEQGIETIRNRVDQFGVAEPLVVGQGEREILVQLPGVKDPERAIALIGKTAQLEFRMLDESMSPEQALSEGVPMMAEVLYAKQIDPVTKQVIGRGQPYLVQRNIMMTGDVIKDAKVQISQAQFNEPYVSMEFNSAGARLFERITGENVGKRMAIVLDGVVQSAPVIRERIPGGNAQITGSFSMEEASDLTIALRSGSLPAPVKILERRTVGPSLGADSIRSGLVATLVACGFIFVFMLLYYKATGLVANFALILNVVLTLGALAAFQGTLTLPGIAGIALTIGMAVDANVLINERIREELRLGKSPMSAVEAGYEKAFSAIIDSNLTTIIAAVALYAYGTGPIKGFAVTLTIGLLASMFTAVFATHVVFDWILSKGGVKRLSI